MKAGWVFLPEWESRSGTAAEEKSHCYDSFRYEILNRCHVNEYRTTRENKDDFIPEWKLSCKHPLISLWFCCRRWFKCFSLDEILLSNRSTKTYWSITVEIMLSFLSCCQCKSPSQRRLQTRFVSKFQKIWEKLRLALMSTIFSVLFCCPKRIFLQVWIC